MERCCHQSNAFVWSSCKYNTGSRYIRSGFGNSDLAVKANNHFGIKCHDWKGESFLKDDDKRNECFRKYKNAAQSFEDHSHFLTGRSRYAFLFDLDVTDYKGWSKGDRKSVV